MIVFYTYIYADTGKSLSHWLSHSLAHDEALVAALEATPEP